MSSISLPGGSGLSLGLNGYWGQLGSDSLKSYCDSAPEYVTLSFVNQAPEHTESGYPGTNFAGHCAAGVFSNKHGVASSLLSECYTIKEGIPYCQERGVKVLLSIGGVYNEAGSNYKVTTDDKGVDFADFLYKAFGPYDQSWDGPRPFDSDDGTTRPAVDGFDFDIEHDLPNSPYIAMINELRRLNSDVIITGAPQCPTSDQYFYMKDMINQAKFDALFIQFYNNPGCDAIPDPSVSWDRFNYDDWEGIVENSECSQNAKLYVGLPASEAAAPGGGYLEPEAMKDLVCALKDKTHFAGISLWDLTRGAGNEIDGKNYNEHVMDALKYGCDPVPVTTTTALTTTTEATSTAESTTTDTTTADVSTTTGVTTTSNASSTDASSTDASSTDASSTDASSTDASSTDASSTDASSTGASSTETATASRSTTVDTTTASGVSSTEDSTASSDTSAATDVTTTHATSATSDASSATETTDSSATSVSGSVTDTTASETSATATDSSADTTETSATGSVLSTGTSSATADVTATSDSSATTDDAATSTTDATLESNTITGTAKTTDSAQETESATAETTFSTFKGWNTTYGAPSYTQKYGDPTTLIPSGTATVTKGSPVYTKYPDNTYAVSMTTSTVCTTRVHTAVDGYVVTETIPLYTTVCPVTGKAKPTNYAVPSQHETKTVYTTSIHTVTKCPPEVVDCPYGSVITETIPVYTTVCPVTEKSKPAPTDVPYNHEIKTLYTSQVNTISHCAPGAPNCVVGAVTTEIASWTTATVPAQQTQPIKIYKPVPEMPKIATKEAHYNGTVYTSVVVPPVTLKTAAKPGVFEQAKPTHQQSSGAAAPTGGYTSVPVSAPTYAPVPITPATAGASSLVVGLTAAAGMVLFQVLAL
ncbi:Endochitinase A1 [Fusarium oxysporum f. sp. rapae]|uniref:chitinase n=1 Tax=Fusarium oxysporum f. sp. rapae TaxID=485398 RepID=A0A8J5P3H9_FUSOX|nr:Endochitinase A1 [Fusarium oxysporum f. sp. rapae]